MSGFAAKLRDFIRADGRAGRVTIARVDGSSPREAGAVMAVRSDGRFSGTIGGGALEWQALREMQRLLVRHQTTSSTERIFSLGPELGQCCGGRVSLRFEVLTSDDLDHLSSEAMAETADHGRTSLLLYGAGHVGRALVLALAPLPFAVQWIDPRPDAYPEAMPRNTTALAPQDLLSPILAAPEPCLVLAISHSHALDLAIVDAALRNPSCAFVGVIGSETKRARFLSQLRQAGHTESTLNRLTCPIGDRTIASKEPAIIAAGVVVQLLREHEHLARTRNNSTPSQTLAASAHAG